MQPYFFPYLGYFQLINSVDKFVIYNNIKFTKKGWINRNRILVNGTDHLISLPLKKDSDFLNIDQRYLSNGWFLERGRMLNRIREAYKNAPYFNQTFDFIEGLLNNSELNLFEFIFSTINQICQKLNIKTEIVISSSIKIDHSLKSADKIIGICKQLNATDYVNSIGGVGLYSKETFAENGLVLKFINSKTTAYLQFNDQFVPKLSIVDVMMFNSQEEIHFQLKQFEFI